MTEIFDRNNRRLDFLPRSDALDANYATDRHDGLTSTSDESSVRLRQAGWRDCWRLWRWRNHPTTRPMMRNREAVGLIEHVRWFAAALRQPARVVYIALANGRPVGSGRIDFSESGRVAEFDIVVAPRWRGHGYGAEIVRLLVDEAACAGAKTMVADIRNENFASLVAFEYAGFQPQHSAKTLYQC